MFIKSSGRGLIRVATATALILSTSSILTPTAIAACTAATSGSDNIVCDGNLDSAFDALGGDDVITFDVTGDIAENAGDVAVLNTGDGNDTIIVDDSLVAIGGGGDATIDTSYGDDTLSFTGSGLSGVYIGRDATSNVTITTGAGADSVTIDRSRTATDGNATIDTGDHNDQVYVKDTIFGDLGDADISTGAGDDIVTFEGSDLGTIAKTPTIDTGDGNDTVNFNDSAASFVSSILTGVGDDTINIDDASVIHSGATLDSGDGNDNLNNQGLIITNVQLNNGDNIVHNEGAITGNVTMGDGDDRFYAYTGSLVTHVDAGAGDNLLVLTGSGSSTLTSRLPSIAGFNKLRKEGTGTWRWNINSTFADPVEITNGIFELDRTMIADVTIGTDGTLAGTNGVIDGLVTNLGQIGGLLSTTSLSDTIINQGTIVSGSFLSMGDGDDIFNNTGGAVNSGDIVNMIPGLDMGAGSDTFINTGVITGYITLGDDDDTTTITQSTTNGGGLLDGGTGFDVVDLNTTETTQQTFDASHLQYINFEELQVNNGNWLFEGNTQMNIFANAGSSTTLSSTSSITGNLNIENGGYVDARGGTVINGNLNTDGVLDIDSTGYGTVTVNGDGTFGPNSVTNIELDNDGATTDYIHLTGTANLDGTLNLIPTGQVPLGSSYTILTADGGYNGEFAAVNSIGGLFYEMDYSDPNNVNVSITLDLPTGGTPNQDIVSNFLNNGINTGGATFGEDYTQVMLNLASLNGNPAINTAGYISTPYFAAVDMLSPEFYDAFTQTNMKAATNFAYTMMDATGFKKEPTNKSLAENMQNVQPICEGLNKQFCRNNAEVWVVTEARYDDHNAEPDYIEYENVALQSTAGVQQTSDDNRTIAGIAGSFFHNNIEVDDISDGETMGLMLGAYAKHLMPKNYVVSGSISGGYANQESRRRLRFAGIDRVAEGDFGTYLVNATLGLNKEHTLYNIDFNFLSNLSWTYSYQKGFTETGANSVNLVMDDVIQDRVDGRVGVEARRNYAYNGRIFDLYGGLYANQILHNKTPVYQAKHQGQPATMGAFSVEGQHYESNFEAMVGADLLNTEFTTLSAELIGSLGRFGDYVGGKITASYDF